MIRIVAKKLINVARDAESHCYPSSLLYYMKIKTVLLDENTRRYTSTRAAKPVPTQQSDEGNRPTIYLICVEISPLIK